MLILALSSAPDVSSRADAVGARSAERLRRLGHEVVELRIRDLPAEPLLWRDLSHPAIVGALDLLDSADAVIVTSAVYQASFAAPLKAFLDLLPMNGLRGKQVLPFMVGGSLAHVLALDYGLRPVLQSLTPAHVSTGRYVLASSITVLDARACFDAVAADEIDQTTDEFADRLAGWSRQPARRDPGVQLRLVGGR